MAATRSARDILAPVLDGSSARTRTNPDGSPVERDRDYKAEEGQRSKEQLQLRLRPEHKAKALKDADRYGLTVSKYITELILGRPHSVSGAPVARPRATASDALLYHVAGNSTLIALEALSRRIASGEAGPLDVEAIEQLRLIRREIVRGTLALRDAYDPDADGER
jgi:hypothetical protein